MSQDAAPPGFEVPLHTALTQPMLFAGVPRTLGILGLTFTLAVSFGLRVWWVGLPLGVVVHGVAIWLTRRDPLWFDVLRVHLKQPTSLDP